MGNVLEAGAAWQLVRDVVNAYDMSWVVGDTIQSSERGSVGRKNG